MIIGYFDRHLPNELLKEYSEKRKEAKLLGKEIPVEATSKKIENFIKKYNGEVLKRIEYFEYPFMDELDVILGFIFIEDEERGYSYEQTKRELNEEITSTVINYHDELLSKLKSIFYPHFNETHEKKLKIITSKTAWYHEYSNEPFAQSEREKIRKLKNKKTVHLQISDSKSNVEYEIDPASGLIYFIYNGTYTKDELKAILKYNFGVKTKTWLKNNPLINELKFLQSELALLKLKLSDLEIVKLEYTEKEHLDRISSYGYVEAQINFVEEKLLEISPVRKGLSQDVSKVNSESLFKQENNLLPSVDLKITVTANAIRHVYLSMFGGKPVTEQNKTLLAKNYGYKSGTQLRNQFVKYKNDDNRLKINTSNKRAANDHIDRFKAILPLLEKENYEAYQRAKKDLQDLETVYYKHH